jgi:hypothetical protein
MSLRKVDLGERGRTYVLDHLRGVNALCDALARLVESASGEVFTLIPPETDVARAYRFEQGGLLKENRDISRVVSLGAGQGSMMPVSSLVELRASISAQSLKANPGAICICDDFNPDWPSELALACPSAFGVGTQTYHLLDAESGLDLIAETMRMTDTVWHGAAAVCLVRPDISTFREASPDSLSRCASSAVEISCTAYDREGFVVWRKA